MPKRREGFWLGKVAGSAVWYICWYDAAAQRTRRKSTGETDQSLAQIKLAEHILGHAAPVKAPRAEAQITLLLHHWNIEHGSQIPSKDINGYMVSTLMEYFGTSAVSALTPDARDRFVAHFRAKGWKDSYINRHLTVVRAALRWAWKKGRLESVPFIQALEENEPPPRHIFTHDEFAEFLDRAWPTEHLFRFVMISANTLSRPDAVLDLTPFQVKHEHGFIELNPAGRKQTKKFRATVPITETLGPWLRYWTDSPYVSWGGKPISRIDGSFATVADDMGLDVSPYCIRHTMATYLAKAGVPMEERNRIMGHKAPGSRMGERYVHFEPTWLKQAKDAIDAFFEALPVNFQRKPPRKLTVVA